MFGSLGITELIIILVILLLLFGARRLPELARGLGQSVRSFKKGISEPQLEDTHTPTSQKEVNQIPTKADVDN